MFAFQTVEALKVTIFDEMRKLGADLMVASYSGGNDEGGVDGIKLFRRAGEDKAEIDASVVEHYEHPLYAAVDELLSHEFGTWAGEFSASGEVTADLTAGTVSREGVMSVDSYDEDSGEY